MPGISITAPEELLSKEPVARDVTERRFYPRVSPPCSTSIIVAGSAGKLLDVSENGLSISTAQQVAPNTVSRISIPLSGVGKPIEVTARVVWVAKTEIGIQLMNLGEEDREQIRKWQAQETNSGENGLRTIARVPSAKWSDKDEFLTSLAATSMAIDNPVPDDVDQRSEKVAAGFEPSHFAPPADNESRANPVNSDSNETLRDVRNNETSRQLAVVATVALFLTLCFGVGAFILNSWLKSSMQVPHAQSTPSAVRVSRRPADIPPGDPKEKSTAEKSFAAPGLNEQKANDSPVTGAASAPNNLRNSGQKINPSSSRWNGTPVDSRNSTVSKNLNAVRDTIPATEAAGSPAISRPASVFPANGETSPTASSNTSAIATDSRDSAAVQGTTNASGVAERPATPLRSSEQSLNTGESSSAGGHSISSGDGGEAVTAGKGASENIPPAIFPSVSTSRPTSVATSAPNIFQDREIRFTIPKNNSSPILHVNGERVVEAKSARIRIQRSVFVPDEHKWWWPLGKKREKEVLLGELISRVDPQPPRAVRGAQRVRVRAIVDRNGSVVDLKPVSGAVELMPAVMRAVRQWQYQPTYVDSSRVETEAYISFEFRPSTRSASQ